MLKEEINVAVNSFAEQVCKRSLIEVKLQKISKALCSSICLRRNVYTAQHFQMPMINHTTFLVTFMHLTPTQWDLGLNPSHKEYQFSFSSIQATFQKASL